MSGSTDQIDKYDEVREMEMSTYGSPMSTPSGLFELNEEMIRDQFMRKEIKQRADHGVFFLRVKNVLRKVLACIVMVFDQLWIEIVPTIIRGSIEERDITDPATIFAPMPQSKIMFYLIILSDGYALELIEKMKTLKLQGFAFQKQYLIGELFHPSTCNALQLHDLKEPLVVFLKYNSFGQLILMGKICENHLMKLNTDEMIKLKEEAESASKRYDQLEKQFKQEVCAMDKKGEWKEV